MWDKVKQAKEAHQAKLRALPNVVGLGIGYKEAGGLKTQTPAVIVFVKNKLPKESLTAEALVPAMLITADAQGVATDVLEVHDLTKLTANQQKQRPVVGGVSISPGNFLLAGTGGLVVERGGVPMLLSNNHVLRLSFLANPGERPQKGTYVRQPAFLDDGEDNIGSLEDWVEMLFPGPNTVDAAIAKLTVPWSPAVLGLGPPSGIDDPQIGQGFQKSGRTTGVTADSVAALEADLQINYSSDPAQPIIAEFTGLVVSQGPVMQAGDSGSVWVAGGKVVALGFAGSDIVSVAIPIKTVFQALSLNLPTSPAN
ncbi:MAG: hypothetical protein Q7T57_07455, partial [Dehalococcoidales bacterium]|nr:hypothetical protein [Dehalococcoidales bacterium]